MIIKHYVILPYGMYAIFKHKLVNFTFMHMGYIDNHCKWHTILQNLDYGFLADLAIGNVCIIYDYGKGKLPQTTSIGCEFIRYVLNKCWLEQEYKVVMYGEDLTEYFSKVYRYLPKYSRKKIKQLKHIVNTEEINLIGIGAIMSHLSTTYDYTLFSNVKVFINSAIEKYDNDTIDKIKSGEIYVQNKIPADVLQINTKL